jgi:hypothetical protein
LIKEICSVKTKNEYIKDSRKKKNVPRTVNSKAIPLGLSISA